MSREKRGFTSEVESGAICYVCLKAVKEKRNAKTGLIDEDHIVRLPVDKQHPGVTLKRHKKTCYVGSTNWLNSDIGKKSGEIYELFLKYKQSTSEKSKRFFGSLKNTISFPSETKGEDTMATKEKKKTAKKKTAKKVETKTVKAEAGDIAAVGRIKYMAHMDISSKKANGSVAWAVDGPNVKGEKKANSDMVAITTPDKKTHRVKVNAVKAFFTK